MTPPLGIALVVIALIDITLTLFAPSLRGRLSSTVGHGVWRAMQPLARRVAVVRELVGALTFLAVLFSWGALVIVGFALIYWPFIPEGFLVDFGADLNRSGTAEFITALYLSMVSMSTLGFGDIVPDDDWLRIIVPLEAMVGFALLTGVISWILSIGPALARRRVLAQRITLMRNAERDVGGGIGHAWDAESLEDALREFARELVAIHSDLLQLPITYYFRDARSETDLAAALPYLLYLARREQARTLERPTALQTQAVMLEEAINAYLRLVAARFLRLDPDLEREAIIQAYVRDFG